MKRATFIIILTILLLLQSVPFSHAITSTPTPSTTKLTPTQKPEEDTSLSDKINSLKERIASKVAQLNLVEKRGVVGKVSSATKNQLKIVDVQGAQKLIDVDEFTKFSSSSAEESFGLSDLTQNTPISVIGTYNKDTRRIRARFISSFVLPIFINGMVTDVDPDEFTILLTSQDKKTYTVDVERLTKTVSFSDDGTPTRSGFSKVKVGDRANVIGFPNKDDTTRIAGTRILLFPSLPKNPNVPLTVEASPTPVEKQATSSSKTKNTLE